MIQAILKIIERGNRFLVASHESPDGDAVASTLALVNALREMGKEVVAYNIDKIPLTYDFLPGVETITSSLADNDIFDAGFILDAGELRRAGNHLKDCCSLLVNIDHHPHSEDFGVIRYVDEDASATGALIYRILSEGGLPLSGDVALCIYTSILADTGSFRYSNANPEAFSIASEMVEKGVDPWDVSAALYESQDAGRLRLLAEALSTLVVSSCGRIASLSVTLEMYRRTGTNSEHTDGFVNYPRSIRGVDVSLFFREIEPGSFKVGFRSKGKIDVGSLARELGGGGHHNAAGAQVDGDIVSVRTSVIKRLEELL